eukprot:1191338-Prorocentrum_minimum.AAC.3
MDWASRSALPSLHAVRPPKPRPLRPPPSTRCAPPNPTLTPGPRPYDPRSETLTAIGLAVHRCSKRAQYG